MFYNKPECLKKVETLGADLSKNNEYITETAGFIPLEVKLHQFQENGLVAQFMQSDFDSNDLREIYLNPDFNISPEDDFEDIQDKIALRNEFMNSIKESKQELLAVGNAEAGTQAGTKEHEEKSPDGDEKK